MPTYDYICNKCGERFEYFQSMSSDPLKYHPDCEQEGSTVTRVISGGTGLIFKGSGFYLTDYSDKGKKKKTGKVDEPKPTKEKKKSNNKTTKKEKSK